MKMRSVTPIRAAKISYLVISAIYCIVGILFIIFPGTSINIIGVTMGIATILFGIVKLIGYFSKDLYRLAFQFDLSCGILLLLLGIVILLNPSGLMSFICIVIGIAVLTDSLFKIQIALDAKRFGISRWWLIAAIAAIAGIMGLFLIIRSARGAHFMTILLGVSLLTEGILNLFTVLHTVRIVKNQHPDVIDVDMDDQEMN